MQFLRLLACLIAVDFAFDAPIPRGLSDEELEVWVQAQVEAETAKLGEEREARRKERKKRNEKFDPKKVSNCDFSTKECWKEFYHMHQDNFEWYDTPIDALRPHLDKLAKVADVLHVGSGSSSWATLLADLAQVQRVVNVDIDDSVIERMRAKHADDSRLTFEVGDAGNLRFESGSFDVVVDKGLLDIFRPRGDDVVEATFAELSRVLRPGGCLIYVSYSSPDRQAELLRINCEYHEGAAGDAKAHLYVCLAPPKAKPEKDKVHVEEL